VASAWEQGGRSSPTASITGIDATTDSPTTVLLLDDHEIVRVGVRDLVDSEDDMTVVAEAGDAATALRLLASTPVDVAVIDVRLGEQSGLDACRSIRGEFPGTACVILTSFDDDEALIEAADAGAVAFLLKQVRSNEIVDSIRKAAKGQVMLDAATVRLAKQRLGSTESALLDQLTEQERRVFDLIGQGKTNRQIGDELFVAEKTVKNYVTSMLNKLQLQRRTEAAALATRIEERRRRRFT
jgi:DNA-binding NarL/FixJ family response regulator